MKIIDFSLLPVTYLWATFSDFCTLFTQKAHKGWVMRKMSQVRIKLEKIILVLLLFQICLPLCFWGNLANKLWDPFMAKLVEVGLTLIRAARGIFYSQNIGQLQLNPNPPGGGHIVLTVIRCQIAQQIIKYRKIEKNI
jgi:hypothetical protein